MLALLHLAVLLADLQVLQELLELGEHVLGSLARTRLDHVAHIVQHLLQILALDALSVLVHRLHGLVAHLLLLLRERVEIGVERLLQLVHQLLQLLVAGAIVERVAKGFLQFAQLAPGKRQAAVLEMQRGFPTSAPAPRRATRRPR